MSSDLPETKLQEGDAIIAQPAFWPTKPNFPAYVDGKSSSAVSEVRAVAFPTRVTMAKDGRCYLGSRCVEAYNGRGDKVSVSAIPYPGDNIYFEFFKNPAGYDDHNGYAELKRQTSPTYQLFLQGMNKKAGIIILRCWPLVNLDDGTKQQVYLRHVFADIEVEVK